MHSVIITLRSHKMLSVFQPWSWPMQIYLDWIITAYKLCYLLERDRNNTVSEKYYYIPVMRDLHTCCNNPSGTLPYSSLASPCP